MNSATELDTLSVKIFADGADLDQFQRFADHPLVSGFTTNPTLLRQAGVSDYELFARRLLDRVRDRPISFEVLADDLDEMRQQALEICTWGPNVFVKVPVMNSRGEFTGPIISRLAEAGVQLNVTAVLTLAQVRGVTACLADGPPCFVSVMAGRIADTGRDPVPLMAEAVEILSTALNASLLWASPRQLWNVFEADTVGCHAITLIPALLAKLPMVGRDLHDVSLETVRMFYSDGVASGLRIAVGARQAS